jgi:predicted phosphodiesterase
MAIPRFSKWFSLPEERMQLLVLFREWTLPRLQPWHLERLQNAPFSHTLMLNDHEVLFFHSSPSSTESWLPSSFSEDELVPLVTNHTADVVVYGHIHTPFIRQVGGRTVVNAGSVGHPTDGDNRAAYLLLESRVKLWRHLTGAATRPLPLARRGSPRPIRWHACG